LRGKKVEVVERDFFKEPFTRDELERLIGDRPITIFISTRAKSYKSTDWDKKTPSKKDAIAAMLKDPTLLRRPILVVGKKLIIGWSEGEYEATVWPVSDVRAGG
jgi:arsenate reductase-like glutaredoxin family protein